MKEPYKLYITIRDPMMMFQDCVCCAKPNTSDVKEIREENYLHGGCIILNLYKEHRLMLYGELVKYFTEEM